MTPTKSSGVANSARAWRGSLFATAAIIVGGLATLFAAAAEAQEIKRGGTLIMARPDEPLTFDPFIPGDNGSIYAIEQVCDALVEADATGLGLRPGTRRILGSVGGRADL